MQKQQQRQQRWNVWRVIILLYIINRVITFTGNISNSGVLMLLTITSNIINSVKTWFYGNIISSVAMWYFVLLANFHLPVWLIVLRKRDQENAKTTTVTAYSCYHWSSLSSRHSGLHDQDITQSLQFRWGV